MRFGKAIIGIVAVLMLPTLGNCKPKHGYKKMLHVAVIDTGLDLNDSRLKDKLCKTGHKDFTGEGLVDLNGHGTHIVGLIERYAESANYCLVIYKYFATGSNAKYNAKHEVDAIAEAVKNHVDVVNISSGGPEFIKREYDLIRFHPRTTFVVAAGNKGHDLDRDCNYYPACYLLDNEKIVGNITETGEMVPSSNYGRMLSATEIGDNVLSTAPNGEMKHITGTSQATAIATGKLIKEMLDAK